MVKKKTEPCPKSSHDFIEGTFESEVIIKDNTEIKAIKKEEIKKLNYLNDPINLAENQINDILIPIPVITPEIYQNYVNNESQNDLILGTLAYYIKNNYYFYQNMWPLIKKQEHTMFKLPPPFIPKEPIEIST